jgi:hypothetical protein
MPGKLMPVQFPPYAAQARLGDRYFMSEHLNRIAIFTVSCISMFCDEVVQILRRMGIEPPKSFAERALSHCHD